MTTVAAIAALPATAGAWAKPEIPPIICGPDQLCQVEPLPEIPPGR
jgi:hypothetical protein